MKYYYREPEDIYKSGINAGLTYKTVFTYNPHFIEWQILNTGLYIDIAEFEQLPVRPFSEAVIREAGGCDKMPLKALIDSYEIGNIPFHLIDQVAFDEFRISMQPGINEYVLKRKYFKFSESAAKRNEEKENADDDYSSDASDYLGYSRSNGCPACNESPCMCSDPGW